MSEFVKPHLRSEDTFAVKIDGKIIFVRPVDGRKHFHNLGYDDGFVNFADPETGEFKGSCGVEWFDRNAVSRWSGKMPYGDDNYIRGLKKDYGAKQEEVIKLTAERDEAQARLRVIVEQCNYLTAQRDKEEVERPVAPGLDKVQRWTLGRRHG